LALRTVIFNHETDAPISPEYRLLNQLGHEVATAGSAQEAVQLLQTEHTDLVVVDADAAEQQEFVNRLNDLPAEQSPRQVAIFTDAIDDSLTSLVRRLERTRVHVLMRPLHMHGLLGVLRSIGTHA
jgi:CheY-like chemotaxis protein